MNGKIEVGHGADAVRAYLSVPDAAGPFRGAVLVIHEVWGLVDHITNIADRFAAEGFLALAPELLDHGDLPAAELGELQSALSNPDPEARNAVQPRLRELFAPLSSPDFAAAALDKVRRCFDELNARPGVGGRVGIVGFCFGGSMSYSLAVQEPRLRAAVPFYGHADFSVAELSGIRCPIQAFYGENDERLMRGLPGFRQRMSEAGVTFRADVFPDCGHAFFNDTNPFAYNPEAAAEAWRTTLGFLDAALNTE